MDDQAQSSACTEHSEGRNQHPGSCSARSALCWQRRMPPELAPRTWKPLKDKQIKRLKQKIGDLVMDIDILKEAVKRHPPMPGTSEP